MGILGTTLENSGSPTQFCNDWDITSTDIRVIGNMIAQCKRDGQDIIADVMSKALLDRAYQLPGETIPVEETQPITIVVLDFEKTLEMIKWIRCAHWMSLNNYLDEPTLIRRDIDMKLTDRLFNTFPSLYEHALRRKSQGGYEGPELVSAFRDDVLDKFHNNVTSKGGQLGIKFDTYNSHLEINSLVLARIFLGDQAQVLSKFTRQEQELITTWTVNTPSVLVEESGLNTLMFGFHPEKTHQIWSDSNNCYSSLGCSNDYGVTIFNKRYSDPFNDHTLRVHSQCSMANLHIEDIDEQIAFELTLT
ncbi:hypothetical protein ISR92_03000 [Patescibacteria group bacterium]|nr:hypothetical protein [Patescibacteria group bacterium]